MPAFKLSKLHRQRGRRRASSRVLDQSELAQLLGVEQKDLQAALEEAQLNYHRDANGSYWASVPLDVLAALDSAARPPGNW